MPHMAIGRVLAKGHVRTYIACACACVLPNKVVARERHTAMGVEWPLNRGQSINRDRVVLILEWSLKEVK